MKIKILTAFVLFTSLIFSGNKHLLGQKGQKAEFQELKTNNNGKGVELEIRFQKGISHYYPLMAIWIEDTSGKYIHPLYVAESIAKGMFDHGTQKDGHWVKGEKIISSALPYWAHKRKNASDDSIFMPTKEHPLPDAYTGATPTSSFLLHTRTNKIAGDKFKVMFEVNQSWDWNEYWYNSKYPGNKEYLKSAQPALVYGVTIILDDSKKEYVMKPLGHSHPYGATGELFEDLSTLTTAKKIADKIIVKLR
jgi:hypothetical protein